MLDKSWMQTEPESELALRHAYQPSYLLEECAGAVSRARRLGKPVLLSLVTPVPACDPLALWASAGAFQGERMLFSKPPVALVALGALRVLSAGGPQRFAVLADAWNRLLEGAVTLTPSEAVQPPAGLSGPLVVGGFSFEANDPLESRGESRPSPDPGWAPFGEALFQLPRWLYTGTEQGGWLTVNLFCHPHEDAAETARRLEDMWVRGQQLVAEAADHAAADAHCSAGNGDQPPLAGGLQHLEFPFPARVEHLQPVDWWYQAVNALVAEMRRGRFQKAVLSRQVRVKLQDAWNLESVLRRLQRRERHSALFAFERGTSVFVGATPERLVRLEDGRVSVACVAGSMARGVTEAQDRALGQRLLEDSKNRREHQAVVETVTRALAPLCHGLKVPPVPVLLKTPSVQHLYTALEAQLDGPMTVLHVAERLHPTPAVCGLPREEALEAIRRWEPFDRGWYAGPVGWMNRFGDGELVVAIRSGLLREQEALLYSGCGIMPDSDPEAEYEESCLKLGVMLSALGAAAEEMPGCRCQPS